MESGFKSYTLPYNLRLAQRPLRSIASALFLACIFLLTATKTQAQNTTDYTVHANIIYHFTKYINWPEDKKTGDFVIGIVGDSPLYEKLKTYSANKAVGGQKIVIRKCSPTEHSFNCHILFISDDESGNLKKIATCLAGSATLIVTETDGSARKGSCINFVIVDERLKLEINKKNIELHDLSIATELVKLGTVVK